MFPNGIGVLSLLGAMLVIFCSLLFSSEVNGDFNHLRYNRTEADYYGLRYCPDASNRTHDFCDIQRDIIWRLKRNGYLWGSRCRSNLRKTNATICGAVLKGSYDVCHGGDPDENQANCHLDCQILSLDSHGDCTVGNHPRERCICYSNRTEEILPEVIPKAKPSPTPIASTPSVVPNDSE